MQYRIRTSQHEAYEKPQINSTAPKPTRQLADEKSRHTYFSEKAVDQVAIQMRATTAGLSEAEGHGASAQETRKSTCCSLKTRIAAAVLSWSSQHEVLVRRKRKDAGSKTDDR